MSSATVGSNASEPCDLDAPKSNAFWLVSCRAHSQTALCVNAEAARGMHAQTGPAVCPLQTERSGPSPHCVVTMLTIGELYLSPVGLSFVTQVRSRPVWLRRIEERSDACLVPSNFGSSSFRPGFGSALVLVTPSLRAFNMHLAGCSTGAAKPFDGLLVPLVGGRKLRRRLAGLAVLCTAELALAVLSCRCEGMPLHAEMPVLLVREVLCPSL